MSWLGWQASPLVILAAAPRRRPRRGGFKKLVTKLKPKTEGDYIRLAHAEEKRKRKGAKRRRDQVAP